MPRQPTDEKANEGACGPYTIEAIVRAIECSPMSKRDEINDGLPLFCESISHFTDTDVHRTRKKFACKLKDYAISNYSPPISCEIGQALVFDKDQNCFVEQIPIFEIC